MKKLIILILGLGLAFAASAASKPIIGTFIDNNATYCEATPDTFVAAAPNTVLIGKQRWAKCFHTGDSTVTVHATTPWQLPIAFVDCHNSKLKQDRVFACSKSTVTGVITCVSNGTISDMLC